MSFNSTTGRTYVVLFFLFSVLNSHQAFCTNDQRVWISLTDPDDDYNETLVSFISDATDTVDVPYDAYKLTGNPDFDIYSKIANDDFKVQALPLLVDDKTVALGIDAVLSGDYQLRLQSIENVDESVVILLEDIQTGLFRNLRVDPLYIFNLTSGTNIQRFKIHFYPPFDFTSTNITCSGNPGSVHLSQPGSHFWNYELKDESNTIIDTDLAFSGTKTLNNLSDGIYTISLHDAYGYQLTKEVALEGKDPVAAQFEVSDEELQVGETLHFFDYSIGASDFTWNFGDGTVIEGDAFPTHSFAQAGEYEVLFTASNSECTDVMSKTIVVLNQFTGISNKDDAFVKIYSYGNDLMVEFSNPQYGFADVQVFNLLGQKIIDEKVVAIGKREFLISESQGYFLVKIGMNRKSIEKKILIQGW